MEDRIEKTAGRFSEMAEQKRLPHAVILEGSEPEDLSRLAQKISQTAVCTALSGIPCGKCRDCRKAVKAVHPDIITIREQDSRRRTISVDLIRQYRADAFIKPNEADRKVYILPDADTMTREAQNALLKTLEEPPDYLLFLLLCSSSASLLPTIRSRSQTYSLMGTTSFTEEELDEAESIARAACSPHTIDLLKATARLQNQKDRYACDRTLEALELILRDAAVLYLSGEEPLSGRRETAELLGKRISSRNLLSIMDIVRKARTQNDRNCNLPLLITCMCAGIHEARNAE